MEENSSESKERSVSRDPDSRSFCESSNSSFVTLEKSMNPKPSTSPGQSFDPVVSDLVGPLVRSTSGYRYLLTIMCAATLVATLALLFSAPVLAVLLLCWQFLSGG